MCRVVGHLGRVVGVVRLWRASLWLPFSFSGTLQKRRWSTKNEGISNFGSLSIRGNQNVTRGPTLPMSSPSRGRLVSPRKDNPDLFNSPQPGGGAGDDLDEDEEGFATMSQLAYQKPTFPAEEEALGHGGSRPGKIVIDPVHGHMYFPGLVVDAIDTPQVQRLRELKQLGTAYYVFPGSSHNRFEHSLGVSHLATNMYEGLRRSSGKAVRGNLNQMDKLSVQLAGLCHDLGHGPFSHVFDNEFLPRRHANWDPKNPAWNHEAMSSDMFEWMVEDNHIDVDAAVVRRVRDLITSNDATAPDGKKFLWDIVANKRNSVDVDKFEYIMRDAYNTGVKGSVDISRMLSMIKVIDDKICFKASEVYNVYELFHTRASLHQKVYTHKKAKGVEYMVVDALAEADIVWNNEISNAIWSPQDFIKLDDTILKRIEWSREPGLQKGRDIVRRIRNRDLYTYVNEYTVPEIDIPNFKPVTEEDITTCQGDNKIPGGLKPSDIVVHNMKIDYSMKNKNPVDSVYFFQEYGDQKCFHIDKSKVSVLLPSAFMERKVRVYSKNRSPEYVEAVDAAFVNHQRRMYKQEQQLTPARKRRRSEPRMSLERNTQ